MFYLLCYRGEFNGHQSMKMKLREISTPELLIVYLNSLETPEWLEKGQNRSRMMCGLDCSIMWC